MPHATMTCSILISVYGKETPENLSLCLDSVFMQTRRADEVVLVMDGPLPKPLLHVAAHYQNNHDEMKLVELSENHGLGLALNAGLHHCMGDLVARMDSDDICMPNRLAVQIDYMEQHPDCDVLGGWVKEFTGDIAHTTSTRRLPEHHADIVRFGRRRNPMNHPTVMFRREAVERVGGYHNVYLFEDYDLWVRMIIDGAHFHNLPIPLLHFRTSPEFFRRRGGLRYMLSEIRLQQSFQSVGYINRWQMTTNIMMRAIVRLLPTSWRRKFYFSMLRK